jgi:lysophospholipase L1-like esterase
MQNIVLFLLGVIGIGLGFEALLRRRAAQPDEPWDTRTLPAPDFQASRIVVLGDSIAYGQYLDETQAWPALLAARLAEDRPQQHWQVVNAGVPGDATADAYLRFQAHVAAYRPRLVLIALGLNDCHRTGGSGRADRRLTHFRQVEMSSWRRSHLVRAIAARLSPPQHPQPKPAAQPRPIVPLADYEAIMTWLARRCQRLGSQPIFLTLPPLAPGLTDGEEWGLWADYNQAIRDLGRALALPVIEISHKFAAGPNWLEDGVHLSADGQAALAERVWQGLQRPNLAPLLGATPSARHGQASNAEMAPSLD